MESVPPSSIASCWAIEELPAMAASGLEVLDPFPQLIFTPPQEGRRGGSARCHDWEWFIHVYTTQKNGESLGGGANLWHCFNHISTCPIISP